MTGIYGINPIGKLIIDILRKKNTSEKIVFIDDNPAKLNTEQWSVPVKFNLDSWKKELESNQKAQMVVALGEKHLLARKKIFHSLSQFSNLQFPVLTDSSALIATDAVIEAGNIICRGTIIGHEVTLKCNSIIWAGAVIEHNTQVGESCYISPNVTISGFVKIGDCTLVGSGAVILPEINIGSNCLVGAGAVVAKNLPDNSVVAGNPAKIIRSNIN
jgi:acetyltransferase EpsM